MSGALLDRTIEMIHPADHAWRKKAILRLEQLTMPHWAMGKILDLAVDLAGITRSLTPKTERRTVVVMAADHGVAIEGVSAYPTEVTQQMLLNFLQGGAAVNILSEQMKVRVVVVDMGVAKPCDALSEDITVFSRRLGEGTRNMAIEPAMTRKQAVASVVAGIEIANRVAAETDVYAGGDMGIGNTTASSAIISVLTGRAPDEVTGCGTGIDSDARRRKVATIEKAIQLNRPSPDDALDVLSKVGGFEIGGIAGIMLGAAAQKKPVILDGLIATAAALIAYTLCPAVADYMIASHLSVEQGHRIALQHLGKEPILHMNLRLGEGTGAVLAMPYLDSAVRIMNRMATFGEAGVTGNTP